MDITPPEIAHYANQHSSKESPLLQKIERDTYAHILMPRMVSGHYQGRFLAMISHLIRPQWILEIGTFTGYSAICLAEGLDTNGKLITIDINEELENRVRGYIKEGNLEKQIDYRIGNAAHIIPTLDHTFDLVFLDADKENYNLYFDLVYEKIRIGGVLLADNVLWSGKILNQKTDKDTRALQAFNHRVATDCRFEKILLPIRDGIMIARKIS